MMPLTRQSPVSCVLARLAVITGLLATAVALLILMLLATLYVLSILMMYTVVH